MLEWDFNIDELEVTDFPFRGYVYALEVDMDKDLDQRIPEEVVYLEETDVDIQRAAKLHNGSLNGADYTVYYKLPENPDATGTDDKYGPITIRRGMFFRGWAYGYTVEGEVEIIRPSQIGGGVSFDVKVKKESSNG